MWAVVPQQQRQQQQPGIPVQQNLVRQQQPGNSGTTESGATAATDGKNYDNVTLKLSYATGDTGMDGLTAIEFERLVEEKSGGKVQINRFPRTVS